ncbi:hypothetical protein [Marinagarivorans algicola]|uniref:hypothetical protein n=1 Tax=Marinagarivorans algicola TaxID=1513270 RepID=UPI0006B95150|nr:hypothetical protein [Marinagarivorans algicola]
MSNTPINEKPHCPKCKQKILQSLSIKCMYCGQILPKQHQPSEAQKTRILERHIKSNEAHDLAMEAKQTQGKKKKGPPKPPDISFITESLE